MCEWIVCLSHIRHTQVLLPFHLSLYAHRTLVRRAGRVRNFGLCLSWWCGKPVIALHVTPCIPYDVTEWACLWLEECVRCAPDRVYTYKSPRYLFLCMCMEVCVCLFVSLRLRGVERRGHSEPVTKLIRQIPVTFSQLRSSAHTMWTALLFLSFVCFLFASFPPPSLASGPCTFLACLFNFQWIIYALQVKGDIFAE